MKRQVQAAFFDAGLTIEREALSIFVAFVEENGGEEELIYSLLDSSVQGVLQAMPETLCLARLSPSLILLFIFMSTLYTFLCLLTSHGEGACRLCHHQSMADKSSTCCCHQPYGTHALINIIAMQPAQPAPR